MLQVSLRSRLGVITNELKEIRPGHVVGSFLIGTERLYNFVNDNPLVHMYPTEFVNDPAVIKKNPKVVAINSAIEVDITGQVLTFFLHLFSERSVNQ